MKKIIELFILISIFSAMALGNVRAAVTNYYVDLTCPQNGNGLASSCAASAGASGAFSSLSNALSKVTGGQPDKALLLKAGQTYPGFTLGAYGSAGHPFTLGAWGTGAKPIISGGTNGIYIRNSYIVVDGLEVSGQSSRGIYIAYPASNVTVRNSYVHNAGDAGIQVYNAVDNLIDGNEVSYNGREGIRITKADSSHPTTGNIVANNDAHHNLRYGILYQAGTGYRVEGAQIYNNRAYHNSTGVYLVLVDGAEVYNNTFADNGRDCKASGDCTGEPYGFAIQSGSNNLIHDNTISNSYKVGIGIYGVVADPANNNQVYRNTITGTISGGGSWWRDLDWESYDSPGVNNQVFENNLLGKGYNIVIDKDTIPNIGGNIVRNNVFGGQGVLYTGGSIGNWVFYDNTTGEPVPTAEATATPTFIPTLTSTPLPTETPTLLPSPTLTDKEKLDILWREAQLHGWNLNP